MHLARSMSYPSCRNCTLRAQGGSFEGVDSTAAGGEGQVGVLMTGTRPAKMGQNLSNDVQDKTADISGSGRFRTFELSARTSVAEGGEWRTRD
jgi:hypothetical protein